MENRIKECQTDVFADRTSTATMRANQLRLWFASMAYVLVCALRRIGLCHTDFAEATCGTIRLKFLKIGALVRVSVRRIKVAMASGCPTAAVWGLAAERLAAHRDNLLRMMLADPASVDALALEIQEQNTKRARLNSGFMWVSRVLHGALPRVHGHVHAFWGEHEMADPAMLNVRIALLRQARPDVAVEIIANAGHWVFYEAAARFNAQLLPIVAM